MQDKFNHFLIQKYEIILGQMPLTHWQSFSSFDAHSGNDEENHNKQSKIVAKSAK